MSARAGGGRGRLLPGGSLALIPKALLLRMSLRCLEWICPEVAANGASGGCKLRQPLHPCSEGEWQACNDGLFAGVVAERVGHKSIVEQAGQAVGPVILFMALISFASIIPKYSSGSSLKVIQ